MGVIPQPALEKNRFEALFRSYIARRGPAFPKPDHSVMFIENRPVDLYVLYTQVGIEGGAAKVLHLRTSIVHSDEFF